MKKSIATQLRKLAHNMPPLVIPLKEENKWKKGTERKTTGRELLECGYKPGEGQVLNPAAGYITTIPPLVNHYDNLKVAYKAEGKLGIKKYMETVDAKHKTLLLKQAIEAAKPKQLDENFESVDGRVQRRILLPEMETLSNVPAEGGNHG